MTQRAIRMGVAGLGRAFSLMLPTFLADPRIELVAACDPRLVARSRFASDFSAPVYETVEQLASDPSVEDPRRSRWALCCAVITSRFNW